MNVNWFRIICVSLLLSTLMSCGSKGSCQVNSLKNNDTIYLTSDIEPEYSGNWQEYLNEKLKKYNGSDVLWPAVILNTSFIVETDGSISNLQIKAEHCRSSYPNELNDTLDNMCTGFKSDVIKLIVESAPWLPAKNSGYPVRFRVIKKFETQPPFEIIPVFTIVEVMPEFPGGASALNDYIAKNKIIPESNVMNQEHGIVYGSFIIAEDGTVTNPKILRGFNQEADIEVIRLITNMPKWKPGMEGKKPVRVRMMLPVKF